MVSPATMPNVRASMMPTVPRRLAPYNGGRVTGYVGGGIYLTKEGRRFIDEGAS